MKPVILPALLAVFSICATCPSPSSAQALNPPTNSAPATVVAAPKHIAANTLFDTAVEDYRLGHLTRALAEVRAYVKAKPSDAGARGLLGFLELKLGPSIAQATTDLDAAVKLDPTNIVNRNNLAIALVQQHQFAAAIPNLQFVAKAAPTDPIAQARLAGAYAVSGNTNRALVIMSNAVKLPNCPIEVVRNYALMLARSGHYDKAAKQFDQVAAVDPTDEEAWESAGDCYAKVNQNTDAVRCFGEALKLGPSDPYRTRFLYATALAETGSDEAAAKQFQYVTVLKPDDVGGWYNLGLVYERMGRSSDAIEAYKQAHQLAPENAPALLNLCGLLIRSGQIGDAVSELTAAVQTQPNVAALHAGLASAYIVQGNTADAQKEFKTALTLDPADNLTRVKLAELYAQQRDWANALDEYDLLVKVVPSSDAFENQRGEALAELKRYPEALQALQLALRLNPNNATAWNNLGAIHEQMNQDDEALTEYKKAAALDPKLTEAKANVDRLTAFMAHPHTIAVAPTTAPIVVEAKPAPVVQAPTPAPTPAPAQAPAATNPQPQLPAPAKPTTGPSSGTIGP